MLSAAALPSASGGETAEPDDSPPRGRPENAAAQYREAFKAISSLLEDPRSPLRSASPLRLDEKARDLVPQLEAAVGAMHRGAGESACDWGVDLDRRGAAAEFPHIAYTRPLARGAALCALSRWESDRRHQAIEDAQAILSFARHVGAAGKAGLVSLTASQDMEALVIDLVCQWMTDAESAALLEDLCRESTRPEGNLAKVALLLETETILPWAGRLIGETDPARLSPEDQKDRERYIAPLLQRYDRETILEHLDDSAEHYRVTGELLDLPPEEFARRFGEHLRRLDGAGNPFSQVGIVECPGIPKGYWGQQRLGAQWAMLQAAARVQQRGPAATKDIVDPCGDRPFDLELSRDGFVLRSGLVIDGKRVTLEFKSDRWRSAP